MSKNDPDNPIYGKNCVITGVLEKMPRKEAMQMIADIGGINQNTVTTETNYLILGNLEYNYTLKGEKSIKLKRAEKYKLKGKDIEILSESTFYDLISEIKL